jgi:hypothetical protein
MFVLDFRSVLTNSGEIRVEEEQRVVELEVEGEFDVAADALWGVLRNFGDVSWLPGAPEPVFEGEGPGMIRSVVIPPLPTAREQLDGIDEEARRVRYHILDGNPMPVREYSASMQVIDAGAGRSRLRWKSTWEPDGVSEEDARNAVSQLYTGVLAGARGNLERICGSGSKAAQRALPTSSG